MSINRWASGRALMAFDLTAQVPVGASVSAASLSLTADRTISAAFNFTLHRLNQNWGEGNSNAGDPGGTGIGAESGDATWTHRFHNTDLWTSVGGSFTAAASATTSVNAVGPYSWSGAGLLADVQAWANNPAQNFGWLLRGDENATSAKRFLSGEDSPPESRPRLSVTYLGAPPLSRRETWLQQYFFVGQHVDDLADLDGDGNVNLLEYAYAYSPLASNVATPGLTIVSPAGPNSDFVITFRRDPRADDLTYELQTSDNLSDWTTIAESVEGGAPSGSGFISEADAPGEAPVKIVTSGESVASPSTRFARLIIVRQQQP